MTNGLHDASNAIATLVATRAATPLQAIVMASIFNMVGPLLLGGAVADTIGGIVTVAPSVATAVIGSGLAGAVAWNLLTWRLGLPSSSGHALVGGLVGAAVVEGGVHAVTGVGSRVGIRLAISPLLGALAALLVIRGIRRLVRRGTRRWHAPVRAGEWGMSAALAFSHGANDAQKLIGVIAALLLAARRIDTLAAPLWAKLVCAAALTVGTTLDGWKIIRTVGRGVDLRLVAAGRPARAAQAVQGVALRAGDVRAGARRRPGRQGDQGPQEPAGRARPFQDSEVQRMTLRGFAREMVADGAPAEALLAMGELMGHLHVEQQRARAEFGTAFACYVRPAGRRRMAGLLGSAGKAGG